MFKKNHFLQEPVVNSLSEQSFQVASNTHIYFFSQVYRTRGGALLRAIWKERERNELIPNHESVLSTHLSLRCQREDVVETTGNSSLFLNNRKVLAGYIQFKGFCGT